METPRTGLSEVTSLVRPVDPGYATNRVVLFLLPVAAIVAGTVAGLGGDAPLASDTPLAGSGFLAVLWTAAAGVLAAFGSWALAREIAPDDEIAGAFLAMGLGFASFVLLDVALAPLFAAMFFARMVLRSTGRAATGLDSMLVAALAGFTAWRIGSPWPAAVGAVAFALDAVLRPGMARQWLFAGLCGAGAVALTSTGLAPDVVPVQPDLPSRTIGTILVVAALARMATTRSVTARGDDTHEPLSVVRLRAGQAVTLLTALAVSASGTEGVEAAGAIWAVIAGVSLPAAWRGLRSG